MKIDVSDYSTVVWRPLSREPLGISAQSLYCQNLESLGYIFVADRVGLSSFKFSWAPKYARVLKHSDSMAGLSSLNFPGGLRKTRVVWNRVRNVPSRSSKVVDFSTNRKRVSTACWSSIVTLILSCPVSEILQVSCWERPQPYSARILGVFFLELWPRGAKTLS